MHTARVPSSSLTNDAMSSSGRRLESPVSRLECACRFTAARALAAATLALCGALSVSAQVTFTSNTTISDTNFAFDNQDITVQGCTVTINGAHSFHSLIVHRNSSNVAGVVTHTAGFSNSGGKGMQLTIATNVTIEGVSGSLVASRMDVVGLGNGPDSGPGAGQSRVNSFGGGGGYGGQGGPSSSGLTGGVSYGSNSAPTDLGSGGGSYNSSTRGGAGGGALRLTVSGVLKVDGQIVADGGVGTVGVAGGGSGGSVWITAGTLNGSGMISANGGASDTQLPGIGGGGGGGGRIAIYACDQQISISRITVNGGFSQYQNGRGLIGTIVVGAGAPGISQQPNSQSISAGGTATFSVIAAGVSPFAYGWRKDGIVLNDGTSAGGGTISGSATAILSITTAGGADSGTYDVVINNACGTTTSNTASLTVMAAPTITHNPVDAVACDGGLAAFTVTATGTAPLAYLWRRNGFALSDNGRISGSNTAALTINPTLAGDAGGFDVIVTNSIGTTTSNAATLTINEPPQITTQPIASQSLCAGGQVTLEVDTSGVVSFQWRRGPVLLVNGANIIGADTAVLTILSAAASDAGSDYNCLVTRADNGCSVASNYAAIDVEIAPSIVTQPIGQSVKTGGQAVFSAQIDGSPPETFHWRKNGAKLVDDGNISGATTMTVSISPVGESDAGSYSLATTNPCGLVTTIAVPLTVSGGRSCLGDLNGDDVVDLSDLAQLLADYGQSNASFGDGDLNEDGVVDLSDLAILLSNFGESC